MNANEKPSHLNSRTKRLLASIAVLGLVAALFAGGLVWATYTSNPQTVEAHGTSGTIKSNVSMGSTSIAYATPGLTGYAACTESVFSAIDVNINFTNAAPGDKCTATVTLTDTGSLPGYLSSTMGASSYGICATNTAINCFEVTDPLAGATNVTIAAGGTYVWTIGIELAPGSTVQGLTAAYIGNAHESIGS